MRNVTRLLAGAGIAAGGSLGGFGASIAAAAPTNAPTAIMGTFDCAGGETGTFVVNSGNAQAATTWNVAHLTFNGGGTGIFVPTVLELTFTGPGIPLQPPTATTKGNGNPPANATCTIMAQEGPFTLSGTVIGRIVMTG